MHQCLRDHMDQLTEGCRQEELKLNIIQSRDIRLRPKLNKLCSEEIAIFCKDVKPGAPGYGTKNRYEMPLLRSDMKWYHTLVQTFGITDWYRLVVSHKK